jgi:hypothetical protein
MVSGVGALARASATSILPAKGSYSNKKSFIFNGLI